MKNEKIFLNFERISLIFIYIIEVIYGDNYINNTNSMFKDSINIISINFTNFDTSKVTTMESMFSNCSSLILLELSNLTTSNVTIDKLRMVLKK